MSRRVLNLDLGFEWLGWSIVYVGDSIDTLVAMGLLRTQKSLRKGGVRQADDTFRRAQEIAHELVQVIDTYKPVVICFETMSHVRSSSTMTKVGHAFGVLACLSQVYHGVPVVSATPNEVRRSLAAESKDEVEQIVRKRLRSVKSREAMQAFETKYPKNKANHVHAWDSLGVYLACKDTQIIRMLRRL